MFWTAEDPGDAAQFAESAPRITPDSPAAVVTIKSPLSISDLHFNGYIAPGGEAGWWQVTDWSGFNRLVQFSLGGG